MACLISVILAVIACSSAFAADQPTTVPATASEDYATALARVFRTQATMPFGAATTRLYLSASDEIDPKARAELLHILDEYNRKVDAAAEEVRKNPPDLHAIVNRAETMGEEWQMQVLEIWMEKHPETKAALARIEAELQDLFDALAEDQKEIVDAVIRAGLPAEKWAEAQKILKEAETQFGAFAARIQKIQQESGRLPENDPRRLESMTILADVEIMKLQTAAKVRQKFRELFPADHHKKLDEELEKLGQ